MFANMLRPSKAGKRHFVYVFLIQNIVFSIQKDVCQLFVEFKPKAGKRSPRAKCWQTYPPNKNLGGSRSFARTARTHETNAVFKSDPLAKFKCKFK
jgi:hypothetical protein